MLARNVIIAAFCVGTVLLLSADRWGVNAVKLPPGSIPLYHPSRDGGDPIGYAAKRAVVAIWNETSFPPPNKTFTQIITSGDWAPAGFHRPHFLINGKYPADPIILDENDFVEVHVINRAGAPTTIHHHGIWSTSSPQMDGVPGVTQWNIYNDEEYVYRFQLVDQYGAYWAHSHTQGLLADGLRWPIYVRPKPGRRKPWYLISNETEDIQQMEQAEEDPIISFHTDEWNVDFTTTMQDNVHKTGVPPACLDSFLINGRGRQYCFGNWSSVVQPLSNVLINANRYINRDFSSKGCLSLVAAKPGLDAITVLDTLYGGTCINTTTPMTVFHAGKAFAAGRRWLNIQVIEANANWADGFSLDGHRMWIVAIDGAYIIPALVDFITPGIGTRLSIMIELDSAKAHRDWPWRMTGTRPLQAVEGIALLTYNATANETYTPTLEEGFRYLTQRNSSVTFGGLISPSAVQWNQTTTHPFDIPERVPLEANVTLHSFASQGSLNVWQVAEQPYDSVKQDDARPFLLSIVEDGVKPDGYMLPYANISLGNVVDMVIHNPLFSVVGKVSACSNPCRLSPSAPDKSYGSYRATVRTRFISTGVGFGSSARPLAPLTGTPSPRLKQPAFASISTIHRGETDWTLLQTAGQSFASTQTLRKRECEWSPNAHTTKCQNLPSNILTLSISLIT